MKTIDLSWDGATVRQIVRVCTTAVYNDGRVVVSRVATRLNADDARSGGDGCGNPTRGVLWTNRWKQLLNYYFDT